MPQRRNQPSRAGSVMKLCPCGSMITRSQVCCRRCWDTVPPPARNAYLIAKDGDCDSGPALEAATAAIRDHLREAQSA